jgi:hypothetical protein
MKSSSSSSTVVIGLDPLCRDPVINGIELGRGAMICSGGGSFRLRLFCG